jgi:hypothetical protein
MWSRKSVGPDDESVIYIMEPAQGLMRCLVEHHILEVLHVVNDSG